MSVIGVGNQLGSQYWEMVLQERSWKFHDIWKKKKEKSVL